MVNHPPHYTSHPSGVECIEVTRMPTRAPYVMDTSTTEMPSTSTTWKKPSKSWGNGNNGGKGGKGRRGKKRGPGNP